MPMTQPVLRILPKLEGLSYHSFPSSLSATDISKLGDRVLNNREKAWNGKRKINREKDREGKESSARISDVKGSPTRN
jgi:hypothetical protein